MDYVFSGKLDTLKSIVAHLRKIAISPTVYLMSLSLQGDTSGSFIICTDKSLIPLVRKELGLSVASPGLVALEAHRNPVKI